MKQYICQKAFSQNAVCLFWKSSNSGREITDEAPLCHLAFQKTLWVINTFSLCKDHAFNTPATIDFWWMRWRWEVLSNRFCLATAVVTRVMGFILTQHTHTHTSLWIKASVWMSLVHKGEQKMSSSCFYCVFVGVEVLVDWPWNWWRPPSWRCWTRCLMMTMLMWLGYVHKHTNTVLIDLYVLSIEVWLDQKMSHCNAIG